MIKWDGRRLLDNDVDKKIPLFLWGVGNVANEVYLKLTEEGIKIDGVFETICYGTSTSISDKKRMWNGYEIQDWDALTQNVKLTDVIMGHAQYHKGKELEKNECVRRVYYVYSPFKTHQDIDVLYYNEHYTDYRRALDVFEESYSKCVFNAYLESRLSEDIEPILRIFQNPISFFDNDIIKLQDDECYVDIGAYNGDTIRQFIKTTKGNFYKVFAYEPDKLYYEKLTEYIACEGLSNIYPNRRGVWNQDGCLFFEVDEQQSGKIASKGEAIEVSKLDTILSGEPVSLIKINMSGSIVECLEGAQEIIRYNKPKIIVNVSLVRDALWKVPVLLKTINSDYKFYLRFNESMASRLTLYVV